MLFAITLYTTRYNAIYYIHTARTRDHHMLTRRNTKTRTWPTHRSQHQKSRKSGINDNSDDSGYRWQCFDKKLVLNGQCSIQNKFETKFTIKKMVYVHSVIVVLKKKSFLRMWPTESVIRYCVKTSLYLSRKSRKGILRKVLNLYLVEWDMFS